MRVKRTRVKQTYAWKAVTLTFTRYPPYIFSFFLAGDSGNPPLVFINVHICMQSQLYWRWLKIRFSTCLLYSGVCLLLTREASLTDLIERLETLRSRSGHFTANSKLQFTVNGFTLPVCPYLGVRLPCLFSFLHFYFSWESVSKITFFFSNRIPRSTSKRVLRSLLSSQTWDCDVLGCKKLCGKSLTSGAWSSRTNVNLKPQTWRQGPGHVTPWRSRFAGNAEKPQS